ncbi:MAG TPA: 4-(cytidine 5'-diphospho)-2-C-methyl-D-erythritol kinase [bacterium]
MNPSGFRLLAPAKVNLSLRVLGRRADGYHEIETVFQRVNLADELTFKRRPAGLRLTSSDPALDVGDENLVIKAASVLRDATGARQGAAIHLTKRVPIAAGLGGGSSDAAATLIGLNHLWQLKLRQERLIELAAEIGSDVPFFLHNCPYAVGRGRGERCEPLESRLGLNQVLVVPEAALSTRDVYAGARFDLTPSRPFSNVVEHALTNGSLSELAQGIQNDLEPEAIRRCPVIPRIQERLRYLGCLSAHVSGSGPSVVGLCLHAEQARETADRLRSDGAAPWRVDVIGTMMDAQALGWPVPAV